MPRFSAARRPRCGSCAGFGRQGTARVEVRPLRGQVRCVAMSIARWNLPSCARRRFGGPRKRACRPSSPPLLLATASSDCRWDPARVPRLDPWRSSSCRCSPCGWSATRPTRCGAPGKKAASCSGASASRWPCWCPPCCASLAGSSTPRNVPRGSRSAAHACCGSQATSTSSTCSGRWRRSPSRRRPMADTWSSIPCSSQGCSGSSGLAPDEPALPNGSTASPPRWALPP